ncbi:TrkA family potassium uptake protein [Flavobacteriaceae bacterium Ap0902]|nr:TrkA family potassium uptake protein [Flavobacteriaceae bacterium Ap0902]
MKIIIVGLGSFGGSLAVYLTNAGHEIIGIDLDMNRVEFYKDKITHTINLDVTDQFTVSGLPIKSTDLVIMAIGENQGASVLGTANFKTLGAKKIIGRAISSVHETILVALGIETIIRPEKESARKWYKKLTTKYLEESFELNREYSIVELRLPEKYIGKTVGEIDFRNNYNLVALTTIQESMVSSPLGGATIHKTVQGVVQHNTILTQDDIIVVYGKNDDIQRFLDK